MDRSRQYLYNSNMTRSTLEQAVLDYNLFGEAGDLPDVVHIETIETRSLLHNWEFATHRHARLHQVLLVESGGGSARLEGQTLPLGAMDFVNVPMGTIHGYTFKPGTRGWVLTLASEMMDVALEPSRELRQALTQALVADVDDRMLAIMREIHAEYLGREFARAQALRALSGLLLGRVARLLARQGAITAPDDGSDRVEAFRALIDAHFSEQWAVADYAAALGITPVHLSRLCHSAVGKPASKLIDERLIHEARRNLVYTNLPVSKIAYALGFADPAYFSRVFARVTGLSPRRFRQLVGQNRDGGEAPATRPDPGS